MRYIICFLLVALSSAAVAQDRIVVTDRRPIVRVYEGPGHNFDRGRSERIVVYAGNVRVIKDSQHIGLRNKAWRHSKFFWRGHYHYMKLAHSLRNSAFHARDRYRHSWRRVE